MPDTGVKIKQYIHRVSVDRKTGKKISESYEPYDEVPEITVEEHADRLLRATVGNVDSYVAKMLDDLKKQEGERTSHDKINREDGTQDVIAG